MKTVVKIALTLVVDDEPYDKIRNVYRFLGVSEVRDYKAYVGFINISTS